MSKLSSETQIAQARANGPTPSAAPADRASGATAQTWSGDNDTAWKTLRWNLRQGLGMCLSGLFNIGHDVGGFHGPTPEPELFCRFIEFCALWPRFVMNSWKSSGIVNLPWMYPDRLPQVHEAYALRYRLMPHIYAAMRRAPRSRMCRLCARSGMDFPDDRVASASKMRSCSATACLVAPVLDQGVDAAPGISAGASGMAGTISTPAVVLPAAKRSRRRPRLDAFRCSRLAAA